MHLITRTFGLLLLGAWAAGVQASSSGVVISQVYGGNGSTYASDYVELFNAGSAAVDITGWSVQYASATGTGNFSANGVTTLSGTLAAKHYYLVKLATTTGTALPAADATGTSNISSSAGKVALVSDSTGLACNGGSTACSAAQLAKIVDLVGYGSANFFEGSAAPGLSTTTALLRANTGCTDTDNNSADFTAGAPTPRNAATTASTCSGGGGGSGTPAAIYQIQGNGATSPLNNALVTTQGVVTKINNNGYFIQDPTGDGDPQTSDGIFVFTSSAPAVSLGQLVSVTATVSEFNTGTSTQSAAHTVTELKNVSSTAVLSSGNSITPTVITLPLASADDMERYEGMLVTINTPLTVSQNYFLGRYGQATLSANGRLIKPSNVYNPHTSTAAFSAMAALNARSQILLDDGSSSQNPSPTPYLAADNTLRAGDTVPGITGTIDYGPATSDSAGLALYKIHPSAVPSFTRANARTAAPAAVGGNVKVASFNVLNFFTTFGDGHTVFGQSGQGCTLGASTAAANCRGADSAAEFTRQVGKIVPALAAINADVVGLMEMQNNGNTAVQYLVDQLNAQVGAGTYASVALPVPASGSGAATGTDAIRVAMIYKPSVLTPVGAPVGDDNAINNRPTLAQTFALTANGEKFTVVVNHFKSKNCDGAAGLDLDQGDSQGCYNDRRQQQAQQLLNFVAARQAAAGNSNVIVIGDLNAYGKEDPIEALTGGGLSDVLAGFVGSSDYSYVFDGESGYIDHALASSALAPRISGAVHWHINADEPSVLDYNLEFKQPACGTCGPDYYAATPYRASDHDPVVIGLNLQPQSAQSINFAALPDQQLNTPTFTITVTATSGLAVSMVSTTMAVCTVTSPGGVVSLLSTGTCSITAGQSGDGSWLPAAAVTQSFNVVKATQTISFGAPGQQTVGMQLSLAASASSGLAVSYASTTPAVCTVAGNLVTLLAAGSCSVVASQAGNAVYAPAADVAQQFAVVATAAATEGDVPIAPMWLLLEALGLLGAARLGWRRRSSTPRS